MQRQCKDQILVELYGYMETMGGDASKWFVGVAHDVEHQLFEQHHVDRGRDRWIWRVAQSSEEAQEVERFFVETIGTDGVLHPVRGPEVCSVYAFRRSLRTRR